MRDGALFKMVAQRRRASCGVAFLRGVWTGTGVNVLEKSDLGQWWCLHLSQRENKREEGKRKASVKEYDKLTLTASCNGNK